MGAAGAFGAAIVGAIVVTLAAEGLFVRYLLRKWRTIRESYSPSKRQDWAVSP